MSCPSHSTRRESTCGEFGIPTVLVPDIEKPILFSGDGEPERRPNLPQIFVSLRDEYGFRPSPERLLCYLSAVAYSDSYREKYADFIRVDFPRLPITANRETFNWLAELGGRLIAIHTLDSSEVNRPSARITGDGNNLVARRKANGFHYDADFQRKYINERQYCAPVPLELWEYQIGGYQTLHKWLKDRKGRRLSSDEIRAYCRVVTALQKTIEIQEEIDALYPEAEADVIDLHLGD